MICEIVVPFDHVHRNLVVFQLLEDLKRLQVGRSVDIPLVEEISCNQQKFSIRMDRIIGNLVKSTRKILEPLIKIVLHIPEMKIARMYKVHARLFAHVAH